MKTDWLCLQWSLNIFKIITDNIGSRIVLGTCLSRINTRIPLQSYGVMLPKNKPSSFCLKLFLTMDEFRIILEYCGLIKGDHLGTGKQKTFGKDLLLYDLVPGVYVVYYYVGSLLHSSQYLYLHKY